MSGTTAGDGHSEQVERVLLFSIILGLESLDGCNTAASVLGLLDDAYIADDALDDNDGVEDVVYWSESVEVCITDDVLALRVGIIDSSNVVESGPKGVKNAECV